MTLKAAASLDYVANSGIFSSRILMSNLNSPKAFIQKTFLKINVIAESSKAQNKQAL